jgi:hypothetical protein
MKTFKKILRYLILIFFIVLASFGLALTGSLFADRHRYANREPTIEMVSKKEDDDEEKEVTVKNNE